MLCYMLDTDIASFIMNRVSLGAIRRIQALPTEATSISAVVESELRFGIAVSPRRQKEQAALDEFLQYMQVLDYPAAASSDYASDTCGSQTARGDDWFKRSPHRRPRAMSWFDARDQQHSRIQTRSWPQDRELGLTNLYDGEPTAATSRPAPLAHSLRRRSGLFRRPEAEFPARSFAAGSCAPWFPSGRAAIGKSRKPTLLPVK